MGASHSSASGKLESKLRPLIYRGYKGEDTYPQIETIINNSEEILKKEFGDKCTKFCESLLYLCVSLYKRGRKEFTDKLFNLILNKVPTSKYEYEESIESALNNRYKEVIEYILSINKPEVNELFLKLAREKVLDYKFSKLYPKFYKFLINKGIEQPTLEEMAKKEHPRFPIITETNLRAAQSWNVETTLNDWKAKKNQLLQMVRPNNGGESERVNFPESGGAMTRRRQNKSHKKTRRNKK